MNTKSIFKINGIVTISAGEKFHSEAALQMICQNALQIKLIGLTASSRLTVLPLANMHEVVDDTPVRRL